MVCLNNLGEWGVSLHCCYQICIIIILIFIIINFKGGKARVEPFAVLLSVWLRLMNSPTLLKCCSFGSGFMDQSYLYSYPIHQRTVL